MTGVVYTSNIQKGGALLDDTRRVVQAWDPLASPEENLQRIADDNVLGKTSRARSDDVLLRIVKPRFVDPGPQVMAALIELLGQPKTFTEACFYETARDEHLLAAFCEGPLWTWWEEGRIGISVIDASSWLAALGDREEIPHWSDTVRTKVARGLLAALRDFGVLRGATRKEFAPPDMTTAGFAYVAWREHEQGASTRALVSSPVWRRWRLGQEDVLDFFSRSSQLGVLRFQQAGSAVRIDWTVSSLEEAARAAA